MAVMTSQHPEAVALEQKTQPVPSSGEMALDLEINGTIPRDETTIDDVLASEPITDDFTSYDLKVNGTKNSDAFTSNATIGDEEEVRHASVEPRAAELAPQKLDALPTSDSLTITKTITKTTTEPNTSPDLLPKPQSTEITPLLDTADAAIDSAIDDIVSASAVPPIVEAPESDLRDSTPPPPPQFPSQSQEPKIEPDTDAETESATKQIAPQSDTLVDTEVAGLTLEPSISTIPSFESTAQAELAQAEISADLDLDLSFDLPLQPEPEPEPSTSIDATMDDSDGLPMLPLVSAPQSSIDTTMEDAPQSIASSKVAREREDDDENGPLAKRTKTDVPLMESINSSISDPGNNGESTETQTTKVPAIESAPPASRLTPYEVKEYIKILKNVIRTQDGKHFRAPVAELWPTIADLYLSKITNPIDIATLESRLRNGTYTTLDEFKADVELLHANAVAFNGVEHTVTRSAGIARDSILNKLARIPPEPAPAPKKEKKAKRSTPVGDEGARAPAPRRPSRGATSMDAPPAQTFALNPQTSTPLIRRDSTKADGGRPKREIHPPKNKDLPYSVRPKSKKFDTELKWCAEVLTELKKPKHYAFANAFYTPVDPVALGIPTYFNVIKTPMDISTVQSKLDNGEYTNSKEFEKDVGLIFANCYKFNPPPNIVNAWGKQLEEVFRAQLSKKAQWIADHAPAVPSHSPTPDSDEEESEDEPPALATNINATAALNKRLVEEQAKLIELMNDRSTEPSIIQMQRDLVTVVQNRVQAEANLAAEATALPKKSKKSKVSKPSKKAAMPKKATTNSKKSGASRPKYMGTLEKEVISAGIGVLADEWSEKILAMIKRDSPNVDVDNDGNVELDIDAVSIPTLWKIYDIVTQHAPDVEPEIRRQLEEREAPREPARPAQKKKNKPMSSSEQERKIEQLKTAVQDFERQASGSQEPLPTVENNDSSGDESSDSEEE